MSAGSCPDLAGLPSCLIEDWYVEASHLRLRRVSEEGRAATWKLCKKYGWPQDLRQPIVNVYLDEAEYHLLRGLPGREIVKRRYTVTASPPTDFFAIDVFHGALAGLITCEVERGSIEAVTAFDPPGWLGREITHDARFFGGTLAGTRLSELAGFGAA